MIRRPCTGFLTRPNACLPACLPPCLRLPVCVYLSVSVIRGRGRPHRRLCLIWLIDWLYWFELLSIGVRWLWSSGAPPSEALSWFGDGPISKLWFNSIDRLIKSFVVFAGWSFDRSSSGSGNGRRLVLATVIWFWWRSSYSGDGLLVTAVWFWWRSSGSGDGRLVLGRSSGSSNGHLVLATVIWF